MSAMPRLTRAVPVTAASPAWLWPGLVSWCPELAAELVADTMNLTEVAATALPW
jgi:hypothetical protein